MKKILFLTVLFSFCFWGASALAAGEEIVSFEDKIDIAANGMTKVTETIVYNLGETPKHGIYRDIPLTSTGGPNLSISNISVKDQSGNSYKFSKSTSGNILQIKIGDEKETSIGEKTYIISYDLFDAVRSFADHDEFYFNVTGNGWQMPIEKARALVSAPVTTSTALKTTCYTGAEGSQAQNCSAAFGGGKANFLTTGALAPGEGLTIVVGFPKGFVHVDRLAALKSKLLNPVVLGVGALIFFILIMMGLLIYWVSGGVPKAVKKNTLVAEYEPPDKLSAVEVGTLYDRRADMPDVSAIIMDLAVRGYLKIRYIDKKTILGSNDFEIVKMKPASGLAGPDLAMFGLLFEKGDKVLLSEMKTRGSSNLVKIEKIKKEVKLILKNKGYFNVLGKGEVKSAIITSLWFFVVLLFLFELLSMSLYFIVLIIIAAAWYIRKMLPLKTSLTPKGIVAGTKIRGFKEYLQVVDKPRLAMLNVPEAKPEVFEKYLPYAMVLGVEKQWAKKFEGIYNAAPNWYEQSGHGTFNSILLVNSLANFNNSFRQNVIFSGNSSSGFSGGFSGGGSGGGGGGSW